MKYLFALLVVLMVGCAHSSKVHMLPPSNAHCETERPMMDADQYVARSYVYCSLGHSLVYKESGTILTVNCECQR